MAEKKRVSVMTSLERAVSDVANAASVAATGSEIGMLELAVEDEINPGPARRRKAKVATKKKVAANKKVATRKKAATRKARKPVERKRSAKRRLR